MKTYLTVAMSVLVALATLLTLAAAPGQTQAQGLAPQSPAAISPGAMPVQGKVTNASGVPLNGTYTMTFTLYESEDGITPLCQDENPVMVTNGLFNSWIDYCYNGDLYGQKVWLGIRVGTDAEMTPRQVVYPVPYALGLVPGAVISSSWSNPNVLTVSTSYGTSTALNVSATGAKGTALSASATGATGTALDIAATSVTGINYGLYASAASADGFAGSFYNSGGGTGISSTSLGGTAVFAGSLGTALVASGGTTSISAEGSGKIKSSAKSYIWIGGNALRPTSTLDITRIDLDSIGGARVFPGIPVGKRNVMLPITITGPLYGQDVRITELEIYWKANDEFEGITAVVMHRQIAVCETETVPPTCFATLLNSHPLGSSCDKDVYSTGCIEHYDLTTNNVLSDSSGILYLTLELNYGSNTWIQIGGVRLTLEHD